MLSRYSLLPSAFSSAPLGSQLWRDDDFDSDLFSLRHRMPQSHIEQTDDAVKVQLAVPGFKENEVDVRVDGNLLRINAQHEDRRQDERKDDSGRVTGWSKAYSSSRVSESFRLPPGLNASGMAKRIEDGMLQITIPKLAIADRPHGQQGQQQQQQQLQQGQQQQQLQQGQPGQQEQPLQKQEGRLQQQQQYGGGMRLWSLPWPPRVTTEEADGGRALVYAVELPGVSKENVRVNVERGNLYLTVVEHNEGHSFAGCGTCTDYTRRAESQLQGGQQQQQQQQQPHDDLGNLQCTQYAERSAVIRLPHYATAEDVRARFEKDRLVVTVAKRGEQQQRSSSIPIQ